MGGKHLKRRKGLFYHLIHLGFTNRLALYIMIFLAAGLAGGFYLALKSIQLCWRTCLLDYCIYSYWYSRQYCIESNCTEKYD
jgi:hypothetical protein